MTTTKSEKASEKAEEPKPKPIEGVAVGRVVHFHVQGRKGVEPRAALVAEVLDPLAGRCNLAAFDSAGNSTPEHDVAYSHEPKPGTWSWPSRK